VALLPAPFAAILKAAERAPWVATALRLASGGLVDHMTLRTAALDAAVRDAIGAGIDQVVILGAGLDARAHRMPELAAATVYEVDHPATQAYKRRRFREAMDAGRVGSKDDVRYVAVDFEQDPLEEALLGAGLRRDAPTLWIWEGVVPYLSPPAMEGTLDAISILSAPGSRLAVTYVIPETTVLGPITKPIAQAALRLVGEPLRGLVSSGTLASRLERAGFRVITDTSLPEWGRQLVPEKPVFSGIHERLAVAER
jgi:methyltransferase (TIGR00027 family)